MSIDELNTKDVLKITKLDKQMSASFEPIFVIIEEDEEDDARENNEEHNRLQGRRAVAMTQTLLPNATRERKSKHSIQLTYSIMARCLRQCCCL